MRRRTEFEKDVRRLTPASPSPRFSRTFDLLWSQFPDLTDLSLNLTPKKTMTSNNSTLGQWRTPITAPLCAFCNKTVYPAEEIMGAGQKFHKLCLKCASCKTILTPGSLNEREKQIYCTGCYRRQFGPRMVGRGHATSYPSDAETPPISPNSNDDDIISNRSLDDTIPDDSDRITPLNSSSSFQSTSDTSFSVGAIKRASAPITPRPASTSVVSGGGFKAASISGNTCPRCSKTVYSAEEIKAAGKSYHRRCYTCANCKSTISGGNYSVHDGELYDNKCYQRLFGPKGLI